MKFILIMTCLSMIMSAHGLALFNSNEQLEITLIIDEDYILSEVEKVRKGKDETGKKFYLDSITSSPGLIRYQGPDGQIREEKLKVKPRGASRLMYCPFPMLKLNFDRDTVLPDSPFYGINNLKLVMPCPYYSLEAGAQSPDKWVNMEKVMYDMYEVVTEKHFKTRPIKLSLQNKSGRGVVGRFPMEGAGKNSRSFSYSGVFGFLIEPDKGVEERIPGIEELDIGESGWSFLKTDMTDWNTLALFNFFIGNGDLDLLDEVRNVKLFVKSNEVKKVKMPNEEGKMKNVVDLNSVRVAYPFLYDLDYSDAVQRHGFNSGKESSALGNAFYTAFHCNKDVANLSGVASQFKSKRDQIEQIVEQSNYIDDRDKSYLKLQVIAPFFSFIADDKNIEKMVKKYSAKCK